MFAGVPEELRPHIDLRAWARDIESDNTTETDPTGGVFVFRSY